MHIEALINKENPLPESYIPNDLIATDDNDNNFHNYVDPSLKPMISAKALPYILKMQAEARKIGYNIIIDSGYRSYNYQRSVYDSFVAEKGPEEAQRLVALPGTSEHQTGLAFDIAYIHGNKYSDDINEGDPEIKWLVDNAHKYGLILRYPKGKSEVTGYKFEPWHYRFVGARLATIIKENNLTLEEYYLNKNRYEKMYKDIVIENAPFVTIIQIAAAYLAIYQERFSEEKIKGIAASYQDDNPNIKIIDITYKTLEFYLKQLEKLNQKELAALATPELMNYAQNNYPSFGR